MKEHGEIVSVGCAVVVNIRSTPDFDPVRNPNDVYIGRYHPRFGTSKWHNPFKIGEDGTREQVLAMYQEYLFRRRKNLLLELQELRGKRLGCWCKPEHCHGDILIKLVEGDI